MNSEIISLVKSIISEYMGRKRTIHVTEETRIAVLGVIPKESFITMKDIDLQSGIQNLPLTRATVSDLKESEKIKKIGKKRFARYGFPETPEPDPKPEKSSDTKKKPPKKLKIKKKTPGESTFGEGSDENSEIEVSKKTSQTSSFTPVNKAAWIKNVNPMACRAVGIWAKENKDSGSHLLNETASQIAKQNHLSLEEVLTAFRALFHYDFGVYREFRDTENGKQRFVWSV